MFAKYLYLRTDEAMVLRVASSLSYTTLIAVVPVIAVVLAVFAEFSIFDDVRTQVQDFVFQYFVPDIGDNIQQHFRTFVKAATKLKAIGLIGIAVTALLLLNTIESSFNFIFAVRKKRKVYTRIAIYALIITICPLLLGTAFSLRGFLLTFKYFHPQELLGYEFFASLLLPNLFMFAIFMLAYRLVPYRKIRFSSSFYGAATAFILSLILRKGFSWFLQMNVTYSTLYGALAAVPLLLIWMYSWWAVVLFGAVTTATIEEFRNKKDVIGKLQERKSLVRKHSSK
jgi:membrane protein